LEWEVSGWPRRGCAGRAAALIVFFYKNTLKKIFLAAKGLVSFLKG
jgi:hypothetical protein